MTKKVQWFTSDNLGAPKLTNDWGSLLNVIDLCLINGFADQPVTSLQVQDGVGILTFANPHKIQQFQWVQISGADDPALNNEFRVLGVPTGNTLEFLVDSPDQMAAGTILCKLSAAGWEKVFSATNKGVYRAKNAVANPYFLRIDNCLDPAYTTTYAKFAKVGILETCSDIDDIGAVQAPYDAADPTKNWIGTGSGTSAKVGWAKWYHAVGGNYVSNTWTESTITSIIGDREWTLVATEDSFFILPNVHHNNVADSYRACSVIYGFGIFENMDMPFLSAYVSYEAVTASKYSGANTTFCEDGHSGLILLKDMSGDYQNTVFSKTRLVLGANGYSGYADVFKLRPGEDIHHTPILCSDKNNFLIGEIPLLRCGLNATPINDPPYTIFSGDGHGYLRRRFIGSSLRYGSIIIDLGEI